MQKHLSSQTSLATATVAESNKSMTQEVALFHIMQKDTKIERVYELLESHEEMMSVKEDIDREVLEDLRDELKGTNPMLIRDLL